MTTTVNTNLATARPFPKIKWRKSHCVWHSGTLVAEFATREEAENFCFTCLGQGEWSINFQWVEINA